MKTKEILLWLLAGAIITALFELNDRSHKIRALEYQHTRDSLVISRLTDTVDTANFLVDHSELVKGD